MPKEDEVIFILMFEDGDKKRVLVTHKLFCNAEVATSIVGNIILPLDDKRLN